MKTPLFFKTACLSILSIAISSCETPNALPKNEVVNNPITYKPVSTGDSIVKKQETKKPTIPLIIKDNVSAGSTATREEIQAAPIREGGQVNYSTKAKANVIFAPVSVPEPTNESYNSVAENEFTLSTESPLSTFSIDVDKASYSNCRRFITGGSLPPADAVRTEEFINYFDYNYPESPNRPVNIYTEVSSCPWNSANRLLHIGIQAKKIPFESIKAMNLVFLVDVSGSMNTFNKLPLLKTSLIMLTQKLRAEDKVSLVAYAGAAGLVLPPTSGSEKNTILSAIENLSAGGSTAGGAGLVLAYRQAEQSFIKDGINRVILATDGDFNVGQSSDKDMKDLIEKERENGIAITTLGFGMGNYKDSKMETIADNGDGNSFYIDNADEARKVLVTEIASTLSLVAKDVKLQLEFNPSKVYAYRLVGYEDRMLKKEDFNNDKKDAGDMGAGHTVTALYEIEPADGRTTHVIDPLKYQTSVSKAGAESNEMLTIKLRYKEPRESQSQLITHVVKDGNTPLDKTSGNFRFSAAVAEFGMILHNSKWKGNATLQSAWELGADAKGKDMEGYRAEFLKLLQTASVLKGQSEIVNR